MKSLLLCAAMVLALSATDAQARWGNSSSGSGRTHSSKSKSSNHYIVRKCKTEACFKKHPSGSYGFVPGEHKK